MADFEYPFTSAGTPNSFPVGESAIVGIDSTGLLAPVTIELGANVTLLLTAAKTDAELVALMQDFIRRYGAGHDGAGGFPTQATKQITSTLTEVAAAD